jgi:hypothetical protein
VHGVEEIVTLLRAVGGLPDLGSVRVELLVVLMSAEVRQLQEVVREQLPAWLLPGFHVSGSRRTFKLKVGNHIV